MSDGGSEPGPSADVRPGRLQESAMLEEIREGLARTPKELPPKYFYDRRGSELFERITRLPEYYLTRAELEILRDGIHDWILSFAPASLVELGAGSARKTRVLLDAMMAGRPDPLFVPVDVSAEFLTEAAAELREEYPGLRVEPEMCDIAEPLDFEVVPDRPVLFALLGSTIGNFGRSAASRLVGRVRGLMKPGDAFLLGADLRPGPEKSVEQVEAAYDDAHGVTARFNRNILRVLNRELGTDFDLAAFDHRAFYNAEKARMEIYLVARCPQATRLPDGTEVSFESGEAVRTEISRKYDRGTVAALFREGGLELVGWFTDSKERYAMALGGLGSRDPGEDGGR